MPSSNQCRDVSDRLEKLSGSISSHFDDKIRSINGELLDAVKSKLVPLRANAGVGIISKFYEVDAKAVSLIRQHRVLESLRYDHMEARRVAIVEAHDTTFK